MNEKKKIHLLLIFINLALYLLVFTCMLIGFLVTNQPIEAYLAFLPMTAGAIGGIVHCCKGKDNSDYD